MYCCTLSSVSSNIQCLYVLVTLLDEQTSRTPPSSKFNFDGYVKCGCEWQKVCWRPFVGKLWKQKNADYSSLWDMFVDYQDGPPNFLD